MDDHPFSDAHEIDVDAPPARAWEAVAAVLPRAFGARGARVARALGCRDAAPAGAWPAPGSAIAGFHVAASEPPRLLALEGAHRFSRYRLAFRVEPRDGGARVVAETEAVFPGVAGRAYRALVIGTRGHVLVTRRILRAVKRRAERA